MKVRRSTRCRTSCRISVGVLSSLSIAWRLVPPECGRQTVPHPIFWDGDSGGQEAYPKQVSLSGYVRTPTIADDRIVFACEDDLWIVGVQGGIARRLTTMAGECSLPRLSADGTRLAFVGRDEGHPELYVMPSEGGVPRRLTYLGSEALYCSSWSRDGRSVYFTSDAGSPFVRETLAFRV